MAEISLARNELSDLADELAALGAIRGMIFGHHGLKSAARKMFCFEHGDSLVFKLPPSAYDAVLALPGASVFAPMADRPAMSNWVVVPSAHSDQWPELARMSHEHVVAQSG